MTGNNSVRVVESSNINKSLFNLGKVFPPSWRGGSPVVDYLGRAGDRRPERGPVWLRDACALSGQ